MESSGNFNTNQIQMDSGEAAAAASSSGELVNMSGSDGSSSETRARIPKKPGRRGRKPSKMDSHAKLERSRQSARECRARKKLRYQYLEELVSSREKAIYSLRNELESYKKHCQEVDDGNVPKEVQKLIDQQQKKKQSTSQASQS